MTLLRAKLAFGASVYINADDLASQRFFIPARTNAGVLWRDSPAGLQKRPGGDHGSIHRDNIVSTKLA